MIWNPGAEGGASAQAVNRHGIVVLELDKIGIRRCVAVLSRVVQFSLSHTIKSSTAAEVQGFACGDALCGADRVSASAAIGS